MNNLYKNRIEVIIKELESGKWVKGNAGALKSSENARNSLGVMCETYMLLSGLGNWERNNMFNAAEDIREYSLPVIVRDFFGFSGITDLMLEGEMVRGLSFPDTVVKLRNVINKG